MRLTHSAFSRWIMGMALLCLGAFNAEASPSATAPTQPTDTFYNVLKSSGADPSVVLSENGFYYATVTTGKEVTLWRSRSLTGLFAETGRVVWRPPVGTAYSRSIWAPEIQRLRGQWVIYVAADDGENKNHRLYALTCASDDPFTGEWHFRGKISPPGQDFWAIDGFAFEAEQRLYFVWSGWEQLADKDQDQHLYIAPMSDPLTISGPRVRISSPSLPWEIRASPHVNEGPQIYLREGVVNLLYSADGSWTNNYGLGLLTASAKSDLLQPDSWKKGQTPLFQSTAEVFGPGHNSLVTSPDGKEPWNVYHAARWDNSGWIRSIRAQPFRWKADHTPDLGTPVSPNHLLALPSGEPHRWRLEAESFSPKDRVMSKVGASGSAATSLMSASAPQLTCHFTAPKAGSYGVALRYEVATTKRRFFGPKLEFQANAATTQTITLDSTSPDHWQSTSFTASLQEGSNTLRIRLQNGSTALDCVDFWPLEE